MATIHLTSSAESERERSLFPGVVGLTQTAGAQGAITSPAVTDTRSGTVGVSEDRFTRTQPGTPIHQRDVRPRLDKSLLRRGREIIESLDTAEAMDLAIGMESLRGILLQLWETAAKSGPIHQDVLAILESAVISVERPTDAQIRLFREAIIDLDNQTLVEAHAEAIRMQFIRAGFTPLALTSELGDGDTTD